MHEDYTNIHEYPCKCIYTKLRFKYTYSYRIIAESETFILVHSVSWNYHSSARQMDSLYIWMNPSFVYNYTHLHGWIFIYSSCTFCVFPSYYIRLRFIYIYIYAGADTGLSSGGGDKIQVTYQSIGIWMFWIRIHTQIFDTTHILPSSMTSKQRYILLRAPVCACGLYYGSCFSYLFKFF